MVGPGEVPRYPICFLTNGGGVTEAMKARQLTKWLGVQIHSNQVPLYYYLCWAHTFNLTERISSIAHSCCAIDGCCVKVGKHGHDLFTRWSRYTPRTGRRTLLVFLYCCYCCYNYSRNNNYNHHHHHYSFHHHCAWTCLLVPDCCAKEKMANYSGARVLTD